MKRALVTGGSGAIGAAICKELAKDDMHVIVHANKNHHSAMNVAQEIMAAGGVAEVMVFDVTDARACQEHLAKICDQGPIEVVVSNAGIAKDGPFAGLRHEDWRHVIDVSLNGFFNVVQPLLMPMIKTRGGGRIIAISSVVGVTGNRGQANYAAAKSGLHGAVRSLALELASRNITVNAVAPGIIDGGMATGLFNDDLIQKIVPLKRPGTPEEVAALTGFLASQRAGYITGQIININGGMA